ncbi:hypothetical protein FRB94_014645 [Tulasnella sp. JGI-2019a]|nr:hypothetical protein FRB94_014645 [Tulasnella sp. JGI-2019a]
MLETLSIARVSQQLAHDLLVAIHTPRCTSFEISYRQGRDSDLDLFNDPALAHITSLPGTHIQLSPLVTIAWGHKGGDIELSISTNAVKLLFSKDRGDWCDTVPAGLPNILEEAGSTEIHLALSRRNEASIILPILGSSQSRITYV